MGAIAALKQTGRTDVQVYSFNATAPAVQAVKDGTMTATLGVDLTSAGKELIDQIPEVIKAATPGGQSPLSPLHDRQQGQRSIRFTEEPSAIEPVGRRASHPLTAVEVAKLVVDSRTMANPHVKQGRLRDHCRSVMARARVAPYDRDLSIDPSSAPRNVWHDRRSRFYAGRVLAR
jgi:hypothetical protein